MTKCTILQQSRSAVSSYPAASTTPSAIKPLDQDQDPVATRSAGIMIDQRPLFQMYVRNT